MKQNRLWPIGTIILFLVSLSLLWGCSAEEPPQPSGSRGEAPGAGARPPQTAIAEVEERNRIIQVGGRLEPRRRLIHSAPSDGVIEEISFRVGDRVAAGDTLFIVDRNQAGQNFKPVPERARIDGVVSTVSGDPGQEVREGDPVVTLIGVDGYLLEAKVSDKDTFSIRVGQEAEAHGVEGETVVGRLLSRSPEPDYETGLFSLRFRFPPSQGLYVGAFLLIDLPAERVEGIFVPPSAVDRRYGRSFLWLVDPESETLIRREISTGAAMGEALLISEGLESGERYLTSPTGREREGAALVGDAGGEG